MFRKFIALSLALVFVLCAGQALADQVRCAGCKTEHFLITHVSDAFEQVSGLKMLPGNTGNKKAVNLLSTGEIDFAYTCKPHQKLVKKFGIDPGLTADWVTTTIARDPIVVVVNPACGVTDLSTDQLKGLFTGTVKNWSEVGGADQAVVLAYMDSSVESGVVTVFKETTVGADGTLSPDAKQLQSPSQMGHYVQSTAGAVTFMGLNSYKEEFGVLSAVNGVQPTRDQIVAGTYPLAVTYNIVHHSGDGPGQELLDFLATPQGTALIDEIMVAIPQKETVLP